MAHIRTRSTASRNRAACSPRARPPQLGQADLDLMDQKAATLRSTPGRRTPAPPQRLRARLVPRRREIAYPMPRRRARPACVRFCVHKASRSARSQTNNHPRISSRPQGFSRHRLPGLPRRPARRDGRQATARCVDDEFCQMKKQSGLTNIYMGSIDLRQLVTTNPTACAHLLGQIIGGSGRPRVVGYRSNLVRHAAVADRGVPVASRCRRARREVPLRAR